MKKSQLKMLVGFLTLLTLASINIFGRDDWPPNCVWGDTINNLKLGLVVSAYHRGADLTPTCILYVKNISTNVPNINLRFPKPPTRINRIELFGPDGYVVKMKSDQHIADFDGVIRTHLYTNGVDQVGYFSIPDNFEITTNGQYKLVISLMASTNTWWHPPTRMEVEPNGRYKNVLVPTTNTPVSFSFPPVTNTFMISTNDFPRK